MVLFTALVALLYAFPLTYQKHRNHRDNSKFGHDYHFLI